MGSASGTGYQDYDLVLGEIYGVRAFEVDDLGRLRSVYMSHNVWGPGENAASCGLCGKGLPGLNCSCGFYAFNKNKSEYEERNRATGVIKAYGRTVIGDKGFRAAKAQLVAICIPDERASHHERFGTPWYAYASLYKKKSSYGFAAWIVHSLLVAVSLCVTLAVIVNGRPDLLWFTLAFLMVNVLCGVGLLQVVQETTRDSTVGLVPRPVRYAEQIKRNYPDVKIFGSRSEMLKAFPLTGEVKRVTPGPGDPDFWTRNA